MHSYIFRERSGTPVRLQCVFRLLLENYWCRYSLSPGVSYHAMPENGSKRQPSSLSTDLFLWTSRY